MGSLEDIQRYSNSRVITKFREEFCFDNEEAEDVFHELLKWLWLAANAGEERICSMYHPMLVMDRMWHTFLVFSREYEDFCEKYFGKRIHHEPHTRADVTAQLKPTPDDPDPLKAFSEEVSDFQSLVYDSLGPETLIKWFVTYPHIYTPEEIQRRARPQFSLHGVVEATRMRSLSKDELLSELEKTHAVPSWCGGPGCGAM